MIAAGGTGRPELLLVVGAGAQIIGVEFVETSATEVKSASGGTGRQEAFAELGEEETDQWNSETIRELTFFIGRA
jgi:hypothetical protein